MLEKAGRWDAHNARRRERYAQDPVYRAKENARRSAHRQAHRPQNRERARRYREAHRDEINKRARARYHAHKHESTSPARKGQLKRYGISPAEYDALLAKQGGACAICRKRSKGRLCVDHCHVTGMVRGLLCNECNSALGYLKDDQASLVAALAYLGVLPRDGPGSAAQRALAVHDVLPPWPTRRAILTYPPSRCSDDAPTMSPMRDALGAELARASEDGEGNKADVLQLIARKLASKALEGDLSAIREIFERIDG
jgi:Recombination endonuclease VII